MWKWSLSLLWEGDQTQAKKKQSLFQFVRKDKEGEDFFNDLKKNPLYAYFYKEKKNTYFLNLCSPNLKCYRAEKYYYYFIFLN